MSVIEELKGLEQRVAQRMAELRPLVDEYHRLEAAEQALSGVGGASSAAVATPTRRRRRGAGAGTGRRGRPRGSGTRAAQAEQLVKDQPGITIPEIADKLGMKQNYLYRVMPQLASDGKIVKSGRGWHPKGT